MEYLADDEYDCEHKGMADDTSDSGAPDGVVYSDPTLIEDPYTHPPPPEPAMMHIRYSQYDGWSPEQIEAHLQEEQSRSHDPNGVCEEQIEYLENIICSLDFWPSAVEIFKERQKEIAQHMTSEQKASKHERRHLQTILRECQAELVRKRPRINE